MDELILADSAALPANFRPQVIPNVCVHVKRSLPAGKGQLAVSQNEEVKPDTILGHFTNITGFSVVNLAKKLNVDPAKADQFLKRPIGQKIYKGELLAEKKELFKPKVLTSPTDGIIEFYNKKTGELRLRFISKETPLVAGVYGIVEQVFAQTGEVVIKTLVTQVYGVIGAGKERSGFLYFLKNDNNFLTQEKLITESMKGQILMTGSFIYPQALKKAVGFGVNGMITGGLDFDTFEAMIGNMNLHHNLGNDSGISLVVTEGFGPNPINEEIFSALKSYNERFIFINGSIGQILLPSLDPNSILTIRKTSLPYSKAPTKTPEVLQRPIIIGAKVKVIWPPFMGACGKIVGVDKTSTVIESGIATYLVTVETASRKFKVPYTNIELI